MSELERQCPPGIPGDAVHIWDIPLAKIDLKGIDLDLPELLSTEELERYRRISHLQARINFLRTRVALRLILASYLRCEASSLTFGYGENGKPHLTGNEISALHFNLSHSGNRCLLAVTSGKDVGIDIEQCQVGRDYAALGQRFFSTAEHSLLENKSDAILFYKMWVLKEASVKARGIRLLEGLDRFECYFTAENNLCIKDSQEQKGAVDWSIYQWQPDENTVAAIVVRSPQANFIKKDLEELFQVA